MSAQTEARVRLAGVILALLLAVVAAPVLDDAVGFLSDAPYVQYLPVILERGTSVCEAAASAVDAIRSAWGGRLP